MSATALAPESDLPSRNAEFDALFDGRLFSILSWAQLDAFWGKLDPAAGWYLYALGEQRPLTPADAQQVTAFLRHLDSLLRQEHAEDYCGIVYADDVDNPRLIKVYDPHNLGSVCGAMGKERVLPGWIISRVLPSDLTPSHIVPQNRRRWWQQFMDLFHSAEK
jgi:hypothetical protein